MDLVISAVAGRAGSTLLQRIFNSRPETLIWGEQAGILNCFCAVKNRLEKWIEEFHSQHENYFNNGENCNQGIANLNPHYQYLEEAVTSSIREFYTKYYAEYADTHDLIGFKEILYGYKELILLRKAYPECSILLLVRNPIDIWQSASSLHWYPLEKLVIQWNERAEEFLKLSQEDSKSCLIKYEDIISKNEEAINVICTLGKLNPTGIDEVLSYKINSSRSDISDRDIEIILAHCMTSMRKLGYCK